MTDTPEPASKLPWIVVGVLGCGALAVVLILGSGFLAYLFLEAKHQRVAPPEPVAPPGPVAPAPVGPAPVAPAPVGPAPVAPAPVGPAPVAPAPVGPAPVVGGRSVPRPGYVRGCVRDENGGMIKLPNVKILVSVTGIAAKSGENVHYLPHLDANGCYELRVPDGTYTGSAAIDITFQEKKFSFFLDSLDDNPGPSEPGFVKDYVWRTHAPPGAKADNTTLTTWQGGTVALLFQFYRNDLRKSVKAAPKGTKLTFTLVPVGPRIDGGEGKTVTYERTYETIGQSLSLLPIGDYTLSGAETLPDGTSRPLLMQKTWNEFAPSIDVTFKPGTTGVWPCNQGFTRTD